MLKRKKETLYFENFDIDSVVTPVDTNALLSLLTEVNYDRGKTKKLVSYFRNSFPLNYQGKRRVQRKAPNLILRVGNERILWNKVMKEVQLGHFAGPFTEIPFRYYIQSPVGLVPKR